MNTSPVCELPRLRNLPRRHRCRPWLWERLEDRTLLAESVLPPAAVATSISVRASTASAVYGQPISLTATVTAEDSASAVAIGGTVTFLDGSNPLGSATLVDGVATLRAPLSSVGINSLGATYSGTP